MLNEKHTVMKKLIYILGLIVILITCSSCRGGREIERYDWVSVYENGRYVIPQRWLYTANSEYVTSRWNTGVDKDYYFSPKPCFDERDSSEMEIDLYFAMQRLFDLTDLNQIISDKEGENLSKDSLERKWSGRLCEYEATVEYKKTDLDSKLKNFLEAQMESGLSDSLIEGVIGKLVVCATITSIGGESFNVPVKLLELPLSRATKSPWCDGLLLYLAQEHGGQYKFTDYAYLPKS